MQTVTGAVVQDRAHAPRRPQRLALYRVLKVFLFLASYYVSACVYVFVRVYRVLHVIQVTK